ncbi:endonuclease domain-containing protein [Agromyces humi]|uniref:endonuclease domain-containing protein n=1 Tax=Agromyces humi TaxID=1766800 RepID=UPI00135762FE|nr:DUF559 domain-containing protein [Agromyces humi]
MRRQRDLPARLTAAEAFTWAEASRAGVGARRLIAAEVDRPFRGIYLPAVDGRDQVALARAYARRMPPTQFFSHSTAAAILGVPLPSSIAGSARIHVSVRLGAQPPRARGVVGHTLAPDRIDVTSLGGLALTSAETTFALLGGMLELDDVIVAGDYLVTGEAPRGGAPAPTTMQALRDSVARHGRGRGVRTLRAALDEIRFGSLSPRETLTRLLIVRSGLPEPELNHPVFDDMGTLLALVDLAYPKRRVGIEYEGDGHREKRRFRADILRRERLEDLGWTIVRLTSDDISPDPPRRVAETLARIESRLRMRGWTP